ncbi:hypothetical protein BaRGS_00026034 [Batillaria attramentaria]|uniref:Uncharacterized protein n=1 Tax=Batillaria attramentaria TaxID=370345 RepID=A0ABD0K5X1_9CAEN
MELVGGDFPVELVRDFPVELVGGDFPVKLVGGDFPKELVGGDFPVEVMRDFPVELVCGDFPHGAIARMRGELAGQSFVEDMKNSSSDAFRRFEIEFCENMTTLAGNSADPAGCKVHSLSQGSNGSIVVDFTLYFSKQVNEQSLTNSIRANENTTPNGDKELSNGMVFVGNTLDVTETRNVRTDDPPPGVRSK